MLSKMDLSDLASGIKKLFDLQETLLIDVSEFELFSNVNENANIILKMQNGKGDKNIIYGKIC